MCMCDGCKMICIYELDDYGTKVYIHYDNDNCPIWIEYVKNDESLGKYHKKK